jgi:two-component system, NtrC family, nitrogen regulation sensor histidine kinase GlnL
VTPGAPGGERELIPSLVEGLFLFDRAGRLARLNPSGERILARSERRLLGKSAREVFPANPELWETVEGALREGRTVRRLEVRLANFKGEQLFLSFSASPSEDTEGGTQGAILLARDETLLRQLERSFRKADQLATLGTLAVGFAHEIKNPLGGIKGATQLLSMELPPGSPLLEHCEVVLREVGRIDGLLEQLMGLTPREAPPFVELNVHEVLNEVAALMERWEGRGRRVIARVFDPSLPPVRGDRRALAQVFLNLLKNAHEASPSWGSITVRTALAPQVVLSPGPHRSGGALEVAIDDEGSGFTEGVLEFSPFFTTKPKGVGLGLVISEQIVQNHGGRLILENRQDAEGRTVGARARVVLPVAQEERR